VIDHLLRIFQSSRATLDERSQMRRQPLRSLLVRIAITPIVQIPGKSFIEIDHTITSQSAQAMFRAKDNDLHFTSAVFSFSLLYSVSRQGAPDAAGGYCEAWRGFLDNQFPSDHVNTSNFSPNALAS
jgi:hypothetical protein